MRRNRSVRETYVARDGMTFDQFVNSRKGPIGSESVDFQDWLLNQYLPVDSAVYAKPVYWWMDNWEKYLAEGEIVESKKRSNRRFKENRGSDFHDIMDSMLTESGVDYSFEGSHSEDSTVQYFVTIGENRRCLLVTIVFGLFDANTVAYIKDENGVAEWKSKSSAEFEHDFREAIEPYVI